MKFNALPSNLLDGFLFDDIVRKEYTIKNRAYGNL